MGLILTYLFTPPPDQPTNANIAYSQVVFYTEVHHYHGSRSEDREAFGLALILMPVSAWLYLDYGQTVLAVLIFVAAFIVIASATFITRRLRAGEGWLFRLAWPAVMAILAAILAFQEQTVVDYLIAKGMNFRYFVSILGSEFFTTLLYHTAGMPFLVGALALSIIALLHHIALGSLTDPENIFSFRGWIVRKTLRIGGPIGFFLSFLFLGLPER
jgi:hypothetical protein